MQDLHLQLEKLIEVRRWAEARHQLQAAFRDAPDDPETHCYAARIASGEGDEAAAGEHIRRALAADPRHRFARLLRFAHLFAAKKHAEAEEAILDLLREAPGDADLLTHYGRLMLFTMHVDKARELLREALRREPAHLEARTLAVLVATVDGDRTAAEGRLSELIRDDPKGRSTAYTLFTVLLDGHRFREAERVGRELLRNDPGNAKLVDALVELRTLTHPLALPAWPAVRFGWAGSAVVWGIAIATLLVLGRVAPAWAGIFGLVYLAYCVYTWVYRAPLRRWIARRGIRGG